MSARFSSQPDPAPAPAEPEEILDGEALDGEPVLSEVRAIEPVPPPGLPAVQAAAVAATGFVAGAATIALIRHHTSRKLARSGLRRGLDALPIVGTRSFLIDIHLIAKPEE